LYIRHEQGKYIYIIIIYDVICLIFHMQIIDEFHMASNR